MNKDRDWKATHELELEHHDGSIEYHRVMLVSIRGVDKAFTQEDWDDSDRPSPSFGWSSEEGWWKYGSSVVVRAVTRTPRGTDAGKWEATHELIVVNKGIKRYVPVMLIGGTSMQMQGAYTKEDWSEKRTPSFGFAPSGKKWIDFSSATSLVRAQGERSKPCTPREYDALAHVESIIHEVYEAIRSCPHGQRAAFGKSIKTIVGHHIEFALALEETDTNNG